MKKIILIIMLAVLSTMAYAEVSHSPSQIKGGNFQPGNYSFDGNVGIGTPTPSTKLHVVGNARITGLVGCDTINTDANGNLVCGTDAGLISEVDGSITNEIQDLQSVTSQGATTTDGITVGSLISNGNVGIGTATPYAKLDIDSSSHQFAFRSRTDNSTNSIAVYGQATSSTGLTTGVYGYSASQAGTGVKGNVGYYGEVLGNTIGVEGTSAGPSGIGVYGYASRSGSNHLTFGVKGVIESSGITSPYSEPSAGVYGLAESTTGYAHGVQGITLSSGGVGVDGEGPRFGVYGTATGTTGIGVTAKASSNTGTTYALYADADSADGFGVYSADGKNYFAENVGIGISPSTYKLHVAGTIKATQDIYVGSGTGTECINFATGGKLCSDATHMWTE